MFNVKLLIALLITIVVLSCSSNIKNSLDYCLILQKDQSNLEPTMSANEKRGNLILDNWNLLLDELQNSTNLKVGITPNGPDSCKYNSYLFTLTHISQSVTTQV